MPRERSRHLRAATEIQRVINDLLQTEVKDPRLADVRISETEVSGDLGVARMFFSTLQPDVDCAPVEQAFAKAMGFLRRRIGQEIRLRRVPELRFEQDRSARRGIEIGRLIAEHSPGPPGSAED
jgi:ribosome-binding factor A